MGACRTTGKVSVGEAMSRTLEKAIHDGCMALFTVGMIGTLWHVGLAQLSDVPVQHSGTQRVVRVR